MSNQQQFNGTFILSIQGEGPEEAAVAPTLREALEARGIDLSTPVMKNGVPVTFEAAIGDGEETVSDGDIVTVAKPGEGA